MCESLTYQHAIKRVAVHRWQRSQATDTRFIQRQARHLVLDPLGREILLWGMRQRQLANGVFHHRSQTETTLKKTSFLGSRMLSRHAAGNWASALMNQRKI
jgi:hypothetical protein